MFILFFPAETESQWRRLQVIKRLNFAAKRHANHLLRFIKIDFTERLRNKLDASKKINGADHSLCELPIISCNNFSAFCPF